MHRNWMGFYKKWVDSRYNEKAVMEEKDKHALFEEVSIARKEWSEAQVRLEWAIGEDHIDYSIYALEAAEKRYEMLLRLAKQKKWELTLSI